MWPLVVSAVAVLALNHAAGDAALASVGDSSLCCVEVEVRGLRPDLQWPSQRCDVYIERAGKRVAHAEPDTLGKIVFAGLPAGHYRLTARGENRTPIGPNLKAHRFPYKTRRWTGTDAREVDLRSAGGRDCAPARLQLHWTKREVQTWTGQVDV